MRRCRLRGMRCSRADVIDAYSYLRTGMARDPQAALVALNRFGLGGRGGVSGDFVNAASDPRGFVKLELSRPNGALLEAPGLQSTSALAQAVFAYQDEGKRAREAAKEVAKEVAKDAVKD